MNVKEVARYLGVSPRSLWRWARLGILTWPLYLGASPRWRREEAERVAREGTGPPLNLSRRGLAERGAGNKWRRAAV